MSLIDILILLGVLAVITMIIISKFKNRSSGKTTSKCAGCSFARTCSKRNREK